MTLEFYIGVQSDRKPLYLVQFSEPPKPPTGKTLSYWALSADAYGDYPDVLMHIYHVGPLPPDEARDGINAAVKDYVGELLTGQRSKAHVDKQE